MSEPQQPFAPSARPARSLGVAAFVRAVLTLPEVTAPQILALADALEGLDDTTGHRSAAADLRLIAGNWTQSRPAAVAAARMDPARLVVRGHAVTSAQLLDAARQMLPGNPLRALIQRLAFACALEEGHSP